MNIKFDGHNITLLAESKAEGEQLENFVKQQSSLATFKQYEVSRYKEKAGVWTFKASVSCDARDTRNICGSEYPYSLCISFSKPN